jgi:Smg protein
MKENVFDVLMYLFENYIDAELEASPDEEALRAELVQIGFPGNEVDKAFTWLEGLMLQQQASIDEGIDPAPSIRVYSSREMEKLDTEMRGFLMHLEQVGVLDHASRELAIDRVMALESDEVELDQLKWVVLMVLFNQPGREAAFAWMEDFVYNGAVDSLH